MPRHRSVCRHQALAPEGWGPTGLGPSGTRKGSGVSRPGTSARTSSVETRPASAAAATTKSIRRPPTAHVLTGGPPVALGSKMPVWPAATTSQMAAASSFQSPPTLAQLSKSAEDVLEELSVGLWRPGVPRVIAVDVERLPQLSLNQRSQRLGCRPEVGTWAIWRPSLTRIASPPEAGPPKSPGAAASQTPVHPASLAWGRAAASPPGGALVS